MRRWWTKPWHIALLPGELVLGDGSDARRIACEPATWAAALAALDTALAEKKPPARVAHVTIADSFARHAIVPWTQGLDTPEALDSYVRMRMEQTCGDDMTGWSLRHDLRYWRRPALAIALPDALLADLNEICARHRLAIRSLLPRVARTLARRRLPADALILLPEGERMLMASRVGARWHHIRMARGDDVAMLAARECRLAGLPAAIPVQLLESAA